MSEDSVLHGLEICSPSLAGRVSGDTVPHGVELCSPSLAVRVARGEGPPRLGVFLGSFDPPHRGHERVIRALQEQFGEVLVLVPAVHPEKTIAAGANAPLALRLEMLRVVEAEAGGKMALGIAHRPLFIQLYRDLVTTLPRCEIFLGLGADCHRKLLASRTYYERWGLPWTHADEETLEFLRSHVLVLERHGADHGPGTIGCLDGLSSTVIRRTVREWRGRGAPPGELDALLQECVAPGVLEILSRSGLYEEGPASPPIQGGAPQETRTAGRDSVHTAEPSFPGALVGRGRCSGRPART